MLKRKTKSILLGSLISISLAQTSWAEESTQSQSRESNSTQSSSSGADSAATTGQGQGTQSTISQSQSMPSGSQSQSTVVNTQQGQDVTASSSSNSQSQSSATHLNQDQSAHTSTTSPLNQNQSASMSSSQQQSGSSSGSITSFQTQSVEAQAGQGQTISTTPSQNQSTNIKAEQGQSLNSSGNTDALQTQTTQNQAGQGQSTTNSNNISTTPPSSNLSINTTQSQTANTSTASTTTQNQKAETQTVQTTTANPTGEAHLSQNQSIDPTQTNATQEQRVNVTANGNTADVLQKAEMSADHLVKLLLQTTVNSQSNIQEKSAYLGENGVVELIQDIKNGIFKIIQKSIVRWVSDHVEMSQNTDISVVQSSNNHNGNFGVIQPNQSTTITIQIRGKDNKPVEAYDLIHGQKMNLIITNRDLSYFEHLYPEYKGNGVFEVQTSFPDFGDYDLNYFFIPANGTLSTVTKTLRVGGGSANPIPKPLIQTTNWTQIVGGNTQIEARIDPLHAGEKSTLSMSFKDAITKQELPLTTFVDVTGIRDDRKKYFFLEKAIVGSQVDFDVIFPEKGTYKLWVQFEREGQKYTVPYVVHVS